MGHEGDHEHADHPGHFHERDVPRRRDFHSRAFTVGVGGPVGSGKTALVLALCRALRDRISLGVVTNDIFTREDAEFLVRNEALPRERIRAVETGGCPHAAIREDISHNLLALEHAGVSGSKLYPGSWSQWVSDRSRPVETGAGPGSDDSSLSSQT